MSFDNPSIFLLKESVLFTTNSSQCNLNPAVGNIPVTTINVLPVKTTLTIWTLDRSIHLTVMDPWERKAKDEETKREKVNKVPWSHIVTRNKANVVD